jgi:Right handed beta helix region
MELRVDDFGCVPNGRVLERVAIAAGSAVLTSPDGGLRATDVGKNIAIPGGVDLDATIVSLANITEVKNALMTAGSNVLTAIFTTDQEERFRKSLHTGRRIVVLGAGPGGQPLLTDVADVTTQMTLVLADAASTTVTGVQATLNRPDFVGLSNYARRSVASVTVDLGDRVIHDAAMTLGSRGLTSPTAKFSRLDLAKTVTIRAAGLFVTTIQSVTSATQASLTAPATSAVTEQDRGADVWKPDLDSDSRPGLERLLASLASQDVESAEICFGPGVYDFTVGAQRAAIGLRNLRNLTFRGAGTGATVIRLMPNQTFEGRADADVIRTFGCRNLTFRDLSVHGSYLTLGNASEQMHGIDLTAGSEEIAVHRVRVFQCAGDGLRLLGSADQKARKIWVEGCRFIQNKRSGVSFQRAAEFVWVRNCYIETTVPSTDQSLDFEPTGAGAPTDIIIESNIIVHQTGTAAVSISGISSTDATRRVTFAHNIVLGGEIFCTDVAELTIKNNIVLVPASDRPPGVLLNLARGGESVRITENLLISEHTGTPAVIHLGASARPVSQALVAGNLCITPGGITPGGQGINLISSSLSSCDDVVIEQNMLVATGPCTEGVRVQSDISAVNGISVRDNDITVKGSGAWATGILFSGNKIHHASAVGNSLRGVATGIKFVGNEFTPTPVCALNRTADTVTKPIDLDRLPGTSSSSGEQPARAARLPARDPAGSSSGKAIPRAASPGTPVTSTSASTPGPVPGFL